MRRTISLAFGAIIILALAACGSDGAATAKVQTATAGAASDNATVTAFAAARTSATPGGGGGTTASGGTTSGGTTGGTRGGFFFATLPAAANSSGGATSAAPRTPGAGQTSVPAGKVSGSTYTDGRGRYRFTIPQDWETQSASQSGVDVQAAPTGPLDGLLQISSESTAALSLDDYAMRVQTSLKGTVTNFQIVPNSAQSATIGGEPARRFEFTGTLGGAAVHSVVFVVRRGTTVYGMILVATQADFDAVVTQAKIITDTFTFL